MRAQGDASLTQSRKRREKPISVCRWLKSLWRGWPIRCVLINSLTMSDSLQYWGHGGDLRWRHWWKRGKRGDKMPEVSPDAWWDRDESLWNVSLFFLSFSLFVLSAPPCASSMVNNRARAWGVMRGDSYSDQEITLIQLSLPQQGSHLGCKII